jgi:carbonic anhydrase
VQFHLHSPAEHTIDGKKFDMELHLVHKSQAGNLTVVGMLLKKGKEIPALKAYWDNLPAKKTSDPQEVSGASVDLAAFIPKKAGYTTYPGSLTTPPCTEGVTWYVLAAPLEVSEAQVTKFQAATGGATNRPVQPLNGRAPAQFKP